MNYIELFGISSSGKSFVKDKIYKDLKRKNYNVQDPKIIIIGNLCTLIQSKII